MDSKEFKRIKDSNEAAVFPDKTIKKLCDEVERLRTVLGDIAERSCCDEVCFAPCSSDRAKAALTGPVALDWTVKVRIIHTVVVKQWPAWSVEDQRFLTLAISGEVGEFANVVKKHWRGDYKDGETLKDYAAKIEDELADIRIYLELLGVAFGFNLDRACDKKLIVLLKRWPEAVPYIQKAEQGLTG